MSALETQRAIGALAQAIQRPRLVIARRDTPCAVCGRPILTGIEAAQWIGVSLAHTGCADTCAGPRGA